MILIQLILSIVVAVTIFWAWKHRTEIKLSWQLPGIFPCVSFVGIAWRFLMQENLEAFDSCLKPHENSEKPRGLWIGSKFLLYVDNIRDVETLLTSSNCVREKMYQYIRDLTNVDGLFTLEGEISRKHRRLVSPSFSEKVVLSYVTIFARRSRELVKDLKEMVDSDAFDIRKYISDCTLDSFTEAIFDIGKVDADGRVMFHRNLKLGQALIGKRFFLPWYQLDWIWKLSGYSKISERVTRESNEEFDQKVMETVLNKGHSDTTTFLKRMLKVCEETDNFTMKEVKAEAVTTFIAGTDTSSAAMAYTILLLAMHPEHQERVFKELKTILPSKDTQLTSEHIGKLTYLELCIKESLRLFPVVSLMAKNVKSGSINLGGYEVRPGVSIVIGVNRIHRKLQYWGPDANKFIPTRFLPENFSKVPRFAYIPFSDGTRNCLGYKYAYVVMKSILASILRNYGLTTPLKLNDLRIRMRVNIFLLNKHMVQIYERNE